MPLFTLHGQPIGGASIALALLASMGGFIFGYDTGQISDILLMRDFLYRFANYVPDDPEANIDGRRFNTYREGLIVALLSIGTLVGALIGAVFADRLGRRRAISLDCIIFIIGVLIQTTAFTSPVQIMMGRFIAGLGVGALSAAVPLYQSETAPKAIRGTLVATYQLFITLGILIAYAICIGTRNIGGGSDGGIGNLASASWRIPIAIGIFFGIFLGIGILFMPESPRWLLERGRTDEARRAMISMRGVGEGTIDAAFERDYREMIDFVESEKSQPKVNWLECFKPRHKLLYRTILGMTLQSLQQLTGANYFFYYGATIFQSVGIDDSFVTQLILGAVNVVCTFLGLYVLERFGRRWPLIIGGLWQSAWLFVFASVGTAHDPETSRSTGQVMIVSAVLFILGYASTWGPGIWIIIGETFPTRTRAKQGALSTSANWLWNFLIAFFTPLITRQIQYAYGFVFAGCNLAGALFVFFFLYESSGLSLEAIDIMYNDPACKPWTSRQWAPPGYENRHEIAQESKAQMKGSAPLKDPQNEYEHKENTGGEKGLGSGASRDSDEVTAADHHQTGLNDNTKV